MTAQDPQPQRTVLLVGAPIADGDAVVLCARVRALVAAMGGAGNEIVLDVGDLRADVRAIDALARLALTARRCDARVTVQRASPELVALLAFCGLRGLLASGGWEPQRQPEQRKHPLDVEERVDRRDAPV